MTAVLPHAPPAKVAAKPKVPEAPAPKAAAAEHNATVKTKFQALLDQMAPKTKPEPSVPHPVSEKKALSPVKLPDHGIEKPKDPKKPDSKEHKTDTGGDASLLAVLQVQVRPDTVKLSPAPETGSVPNAAEKVKSQQKDEKRTASPNGSVTAWNPGSPETGRNRNQTPGAAVRGDRAEEKPKVFVVDRRTEVKEKEKLKLPGAEAAAQQPVNSAGDVQAPGKNPDAKTDQVQVSFQAVAGKGQGQGSFDLQTPAAPASPRDAASFQQYLVERGYGQMVDQARIVLKDQNAGEIRMTLHPESLGRVKVSLNLSDNSLAGQIFVENQTVKDVFQANMDGLLQAFRDGGWNNLSLQVSVGGGRGEGTGGQPSQQAPQAQDYGRQVAQTVSVEGQSNRIGSWNDRQINLTA